MDELERKVRDLESDIRTLRLELEDVRGELKIEIQNIRQEIKDAFRHHEEQYHGKEY